MARPRLPLDATAIEGMAAVGATDVEIAHFLGCSVDTLNRRFAENLAKSRAGMRLRLRQAQYKQAIAGDRTMLVWLGKVMLGQKETTVTELHDMPQVVVE